MHVWHLFVYCLDLVGQCAACDGSLLTIILLRAILLTRTHLPTNRTHKLIKVKCNHKRKLISVATPPTTRRIRHIRRVSRNTKVGVTRRLSGILTLMNQSGNIRRVRLFTTMSTGSLNTTGTVLGVIGVNYRSLIYLTYHSLRHRAIMTSMRAISNLNQGGLRRSKVHHVIPAGRGTGSHRSDTIGTGSSTPSNLTYVIKGPRHSGINTTNKYTKLGHSNNTRTQSRTTGSSRRSLITRGQNRIGSIRRRQQRRSLRRQRSSRTLTSTTPTGRHRKSIRHRRTRQSISVGTTRQNSTVRRSHSTNRTTQGRINKTGRHLGRGYLRGNKSNSHRNDGNTTSSNRATRRRRTIHRLVSNIHRMNSFQERVWL